MPQGSFFSRLRAASPAAAMAAELLRHAWPVLVAQWLSMAMMVADTLIVGRYGTVDLAGVAVGSSISISVTILFSGVLQAVSPTVAHLVGARRHSRVGFATQQGFWLALLLAVPGVLMLRFPQPILALTGVEGEVATRAADYLAAMAWGLPASLIYRTFYAMSNGVGHPRVLMVVSAVMAATHLPLAWSLTHGVGGLPPLGAVGCGVSSAIVYWLGVACAAAAMVVHPQLRGLRLFSRWRLPRARALGGLLRLGVPMGLSSFIDVSSFTIIALFAARLGADTVAGHRVVSNFTGLVYMVPLSLSIATMVMVGQAQGARDPARARLAVRVGLGLVGALAVGIGTGLWWLRGPLVAFSTTDPAVIAIGLGLMAYLCAYQFFDATQTLLAFALRGYKVSFVPMLLHTACLWGVGVAGGYWLSFGPAAVLHGNAIQGFWLAIVLATLLATVLLAALTRVVVRAAGQAS